MNKTTKTVIAFIIYSVSSVIFLYSNFITKSESKEKQEMIILLFNAKLDGINTKIDDIKFLIMEEKKKWKVM